MKQKDWVKINFFRDRKNAMDEANQIKLLQENNLYPKHFDMPLTLQFELTTHCNVFCKHCYNNSGLHNEYKDLMTPEKWKEFAKYLVSKGGIFQCVISGGEPLLLGNNLFDIMDILHDDGTHFLVISNGFLMTREKVKRFAKYRYKWFQISIDGATATWHDDFRQRKGSWERAINAVFMLVNEGIPVTIAHSVTPGNLKDIDEMCKLAYSLGASSIIVGEVTPSGRSANSMDLVLNREQKNYLQEKINENISLYSGKMMIQRSASTKISLQRYANTPNTGAIIRPNGDIRLDCMAPFVIGNVLKEDFYEVWNKKVDTCWQHPLVKKYINGYEDYRDINHSIKNYFDKDIYI